MKVKICPRIFVVALIVNTIFAGIILLSSVSLFAQTSSLDSPAGARVRALNNSLLSLHGQMQRSDASNEPTLRGQAANVIAQRAAALSNLIQTNPHEALTFAFSPELLADLAAKFPQSAAQLESHEVVTGTIAHWTADYPGMKASRSSWVMHSSGRVLYMHFAGREPDSAKGDQLFTATGVVAGRFMAVENGAPVRASSIQTSAASDNAGKLMASTNSKDFAWTSLMFVFGFSFAVPRRSWKPCITRNQARKLLQHLSIFTTIFALILWTSIPVQAQNSCTTSGAQNTVVLLVNLPNATLPSGVTQAAMQDVFFARNTPGVSVNGYLQDASYGQLSTSGDVFGPYFLGGTYSSCSDVSGAMLNDTLAAATASGVNLSNYNRVFVVFPDVFGCGWAGYTSNSCTISSASGSYNASLAFVSAAYATPRAQGVEISAHEFGHDLGLFHSGSITNSGFTLGPLSSPGTFSDFGLDYWSVMGASDLGHFPSQQKLFLGWLGSANYQIVQSSGTYTIQPLETNPPGLQALKIQRGTGNSAWLWVEYRQPVGNYDSNLIAVVPGVYSGALIHYEDSTTDQIPSHTYLLNATPTDTSFNNPELSVGQTWSDPYSNLSLSVVSANATGLTVNVSYGATPCTSSVPTVVVSPLNPSINPGQTASYAATVSNNDSTGCSSSTISLGSNAPSGWSTSLSTSAVTLSPGQSASVTMGKGAPMGTAAGTYAVNLNAVNTSASTSATANATVVTPPALAVTVSLPGTSFAPPSTIPITASVMSNGSPASGVGVSFKMTTPSGSSTTQSATTNSSGVATWSYKLSGKSQPGTYTVVAQTGSSSGGNGKHNAASSLSATSAPATFTVQ
jgi:M6 family metalloprotease-like protein